MSIQRSEGGFSKEANEICAAITDFLADMMDYDFVKQLG